MKIKDLPLELQELAHRRQREQGNDGTFNGDVLDGAGARNFDWDKTPEKELWEDIWNEENVDVIRAHPLFPKQTYQIY